MDLRISCSRGGIKKRIKNAWYKQDFNLWIKLLIKLSVLSDNDVKDNSGVFIMLRMRWGLRKDLAVSEPGFTFGYDTGVESGDICIEVMRKRYVCEKSVETRFVNVRAPLPICHISIT